MARCGEGNLFEDAGAVLREGRLPGLTGLGPGQSARVSLREVGGSGVAQRAGEPEMRYEARGAAQSVIQLAHLLDLGKPTGLLGAHASLSGYLARLNTRTVFPRALAVGGRRFFPAPEGAGRAPPGPLDSAAASARPL